MKRILFNFALLTTGSLLLANTVACSSSGASSLEEEVDGENGATGSVLVLCQATVQVMAMRVPVEAAVHREAGRGCRERVDRSQKIR